MVIIFSLFSRGNRGISIKTRRKSHIFKIINFVLFWTIFGRKPLDISRFCDSLLSVRTFFFGWSTFDELENRKITKNMFINRIIIISPIHFDTRCVKWYWIKAIGQNSEFKSHQWEIIPFVILFAAIVNSD